MACPLTFEFQNEIVIDNDQDSFCVILKSLEGARFSSVLEVQISKNKVYPDQNKKMIGALSDLLRISGKGLIGPEMWHHFRFGGYRATSIYVLLLMERPNCPVGHLRKDFLNVILREAAAELD